MDMAKYRQLFLSEAGEHVAALMRLLVTLDDHPDDQDAIHTAFREAHSIKGMARTMGYMATADVAHALEDLLDGLRAGSAAGSATMDRMLGGADLLEQLLADLAAGREERDVTTFLAGDVVPAPVELELALEPPFPEREAPAIVPPAAAPLFEPVATAEMPLCHLLIRLEDTAEAPAARLLLLCRELARLGTLVNTQPALAELEHGAGERTLEAWLRTELSPSRLEELLAGFLDVARVRVNLGDEATANDTAARTVRVRTDLLDHFIRLAGEMITTRTMLEDARKHGHGEQLKEGLSRLSRQVTDLHYHVLQVRMMPLQAVTDRLPRLVRDLARRQGKKVQLTLTGEQVELDRAILDALADPLVHLVRNAVDHGIEHEGEIRVAAWREKDMVLIEVADNGRGIDPERVRARALEKGLLTAAQARAMAEVDLLHLICKPGFSTATAVTDTSGRGVGMDVVRAAVDRLGGTLHIASTRGEGSRIQLKLPLSVAILRVLLVVCDGRTLAIPITRVLRTLEVPQDQLRSSGRQLVLGLDEDIIPLLSLRKALKMPPAPMKGAVPVVLTELRGRRVGLVVDRLAGQQEVFVQQPPYPLDRVDGVTGSTILGDGRVILLVDFQALLAGMTPLASRKGKTDE